jgi:hypothetical protein
MNCRYAMFISVQPDPRKLSSIFVALDFFVTFAFIRTALLTRVERTGEWLRTKCLVVTARGGDGGGGAKGDEYVAGGNVHEVKDIRK